jgi:hypothetical protein
MIDDGGGHGGGGGGAFTPGVMLEAFDSILDLLADRISRRMMAGRERMIHQRQSELGPRRHREAVKRRLANGEGGAGISADGRKYLLTPAAVLEELARSPEPAAARPAPPASEPAPVSRERELAAFERKLHQGLRLVNDGGGRRK